MEQISLDGSGPAIIFLQAKQPGAAVLNCYSIPTGYAAVLHNLVCTPVKLFNIGLELMKLGTNNLQFLVEN